MLALHLCPEATVLQWGVCVCGNCSKLCELDRRGGKFPTSQWGYASSYGAIQTYCVWLNQLDLFLSELICMWKQ